MNSVLVVKGQANASAIVRSLLDQHGLPALTKEGSDVLSAKFEAGLVIGHGVVSFDGRPLIDELQAIHADPETRPRFFEAAEPSSPAGSGDLPNPYAPGTFSITRQHLIERRDPQRAAALREAARKIQPAKDDGGNPFVRGPSWNVTEQHRIFKADPARAEQLQRAANP
jgi:hypothetical protein